MRKGQTMATTAETLRAYRGPAILSYGFRPFFLGGSIWAAAAMVLFIPMLQGNLALPTALNPIDWHQHELLYGFLPAIVAGFLLTAVPNWTGRLPVAGAPLAALFALWLLGRAAVASSALIGAGAAAAVDMLFLIALGIIVGREIWASGNKNNLKILVLVSLLAVGNLVFHVETWTSGTADYGKRIGIAAAILLISVIGGPHRSELHEELARQARARTRCQHRSASSMSWPSRRRLSRWLPGYSRPPAW